MAWTGSDLAAIEAAIARGEKSVQFADRLVSYRSIEELLQARAVIKAALAGDSRIRYGVAEKGF
jgi:hypothetical protein